MVICSISFTSLCRHHTQLWCSLQWVHTQLTQRPLRNKSSRLDLQSVVGSKWAKCLAQEYVCYHNWKRGGGGGGAVSVSSTKSLSGHLRDVFCPIFAHFNLSLQLFPFPSPPVPQVGAARFPSGLSLAERADEVSIDLILWKTYWQRPEKARPGTKSSLAHFFPKVSTRRKTEKHNYSSYWLIFFFFFSP